MKKLLITMLMLFSYCNVNANELLNWDMFEVGISADVIAIDPEINNTHKNPGGRIGITGSYKYLYFMGDAVKHNNKRFDDQPMLDDYTRLEVGINLGELNNLRLGVQGIPKWDMIGYRLRGYHNLPYGIQAEPYIGFMKSMKDRGTPLYHSSTTELGVIFRKYVFGNMVLRAGYETMLMNKHTSYDYGFLGLEMKF